MANSYSTPITPPNPLEAGAGRRIESSWTTKAGDTLNRLLAQYGAGQLVISQGFEDDLCRWNGAALDVAEWAIPKLTDRHATLDIIIYAESITAVGTVEFISANTAAVATINPAVGAPAIYTTTLNVGPPAAIVDYITMRLTGASSNDVKVYAVAAAYQPLANPLVAQLIDGAEPFGINSMGPDHCLDAALAQQMREATRLVRERPRSLQAWSGLQGLSGYSGADSTMTTRAYLQLARAWPGAAGAGITYTLTAKVLPDAGADTYIYYAVRGPAEAWPTSMNPIKVPMGGGPAYWVATQFTLPEEYVTARYRYPTCIVGADTRTLTEVGRTTANVLALSSWGA